MAIKLNTPVQIHLTSSVESVRASLEPYRVWIEQTIGVPLSETLTLEVDSNPGDAVAEELLEGLLLPSAIKERNRSWRTLIEGWSLPPGLSPSESLPLPSASAKLMRLPSTCGKSIGKTVPSPSSCGV